MTNTKHYWIDEKIWAEDERIDKDFGRWYNKNSYRTVQFAKYREADDFDKYMVKNGNYKPQKQWGKYYLSFWGGGRKDKELLFKTKKEAIAKLKRVLATSDMKYKRR